MDSVYPQLSKNEGWRQTETQTKQVQTMKKNLQTFAASSFGQGLFSSSNKQHSQNWLTDGFKTIQEFTAGIVASVYDPFGKVISSLFHVRPSDMVNNIIGRYLPVFLLFITVLIGADRIYQFSKTSMDCLKPPEFYDKDNQREQDRFSWMAEYCTSVSTYYIPPMEPIPRFNKRRGEPRVAYYHWIGLILICAALMLSIPSIAYRGICSIMNIPFENWALYAERVNYREVGSKARKKELKMAAGKIFGWLRINRGNWNLGWLSFLTVKVLNICVLISLFYFLHFTIGHGFNTWGFSVIYAFYEGKNMEESPIFARVVLCDVPLLLDPENTRVWTLQCHLKANAFLEKILFILWFTIIMLGILATLNLVLAMVQLCCKSHKKVRDLLCGKEECLTLLNSTDEKDQEAVKEFCKLLEGDGILFFVLIEKHLSVDLSSDLCYEMFIKFLDADKYNNQIATIKTEGDRLTHTVIKMEGEEEPANGFDVYNIEEEDG